MPNDTRALSHAPLAAAVPSLLMSRSNRGPTVPFSVEIHSSKYREEGEGFEDVVQRVARGLSDGPSHYESLDDILGGLRFLPAGRIQAAVGARRRITPYNCLSGDTEVLTEHGFQRLDQLAGSSGHVLSPASGEFEPCTFESFGEQQLYDVVVSYSSGGQERSGTTTRRATAGHRWVLQDGTVTQTLRKGDLLRAGRSSLEPAAYGWAWGFVFGDGSEQREGKFGVRLCGKKARHLPRLLQAYADAGVTYPQSLEGDPYVTLETHLPLKDLPRGYPATVVAGFVQGLLAADGCFSDIRDGQDPFSFSGPEEVVCWVADHLVLADYAPCGAPRAIGGMETNYGERSQPLWGVNFRRSADHKGFRVKSITPVEVETVYCAVEPRFRQLTLRGGLATGNCFVSGDIQDSFVDGDGAIMAMAAEAAQTMRLGGGIGYDFSGLRERGAEIKSLGSQSSGPLSFMQIYDAICRCVASAGHRRGAQMGVLRVDHPDIEEFVGAKTNQDQLTGFNLSIAVTDEFMWAVRSGERFSLRFRGEHRRWVDAQALWERIMRTTWDWAEPGVLFIDRINGQNNLSYCEQIVATNPCVPGDTPILTREGHVAIVDRVGLPTDVWNGDGWSTVTPYSTGVNELLRVTLSNGRTLRVTPGHGFYLADGRRVDARHLGIGDRLEKATMPVVEGGRDPDAKDGYSQGFYSGDGSAGNTKSWVYAPKYGCVARLRGSTGANEHPVRVWSHGPMLDKRYVPVEATLPYCLDWLAGLLDADGTVENSGALPRLQVGSIDRRFALDVQLMLTRMGVSAHVGECPIRETDKWGSGAVFWRLGINQADVQLLLALGLRTSRLALERGTPQRDARRFVTVVDVSEVYALEETFCFTEPLRGRGVFDGVLTAQCGEQPLPPYGACLLGSFNLTQYLCPLSTRSPGKPGWTFNEGKLRADIPSVVRAMDNVVDRAIYPLPQQQREAHSKRRMGLGVTGLANAAEACGFPYGSASFIRFTRSVLELIRDEAYASSVALASEKGAFELFEAKPYCSSPFIRTLPREVRLDMARWGVRNSHLLSQAPTGTISLAADNISASIEPVFAHEFDRTVQTFEGPRTETVVDYGVTFLGHRGVLSRDVTAEQHVDVLCAAARLVDSAVSKTCNVSPSMPWDDFKGIYMRAWEGGAKGCTTFNSGGKRFGVLVEKPSEEEYEEMRGQSCSIDPFSGRKSCE